jgi:hypothetical protein
MRSFTCRRLFGMVVPMPIFPDDVMRILSVPGLVLPVLKSIEYEDCSISIESRIVVLPFGQNPSGIFGLFLISSG